MGAQFLCAVLYLISCFQQGRLVLKGETEGLSLQLVLFEATTEDMPCTGHWLRRPMSNLL